jgi:hypothetical protein
VTASAGAGSADRTPERAEAEGAAHGGEGGPRSAALVLAVSLAVVFGIVAAVLAVLVAGDDGGSQADDELRAAAGAAAEALLTYEFEDPEAHRDAVLGLATGSFRSEYEDAFDQSLRELITQVQASSEGFAKEIYVSAIDEERAEAIVVTDVTRDGAGGPRTLFDIYMLLTFVEVDGEWKVDQVTDLNFRAEGSNDAGAGSTTSTSAPVP